MTSIMRLRIMAVLPAPTLFSALAEKSVAACINRASPVIWRVDIKTKKM